MWNINKKERLNKIEYNFNKAIEGAHYTTWEMSKEDLNWLIDENRKAIFLIEEILCQLKHPLHHGYIYQICEKFLENE